MPSRGTQAKQSLRGDRGAGSMRGRTGPAYPQQTMMARHFVTKNEVSRRYKVPEVPSDVRNTHRKIGLLFCCACSVDLPNGSAVVVGHEHVLVGRELPGQRSITRKCRSASHWNTFDDTVPSTVQPCTPFLKSAWAMMSPGPARRPSSTGIAPSKRAKDTNTHPTTQREVWR
jgi:hypothetical protein